ncbi:MAG: hypothetical protein ABII26_01090 [Pseudomonadota bacterium]
MGTLALKILIAFALAFFICPIHVLAENYIQYFDHGKIDWSNRIIEAMGNGEPPADSINPAQARAMAKRKAVINARQNLYGLIKGLRVDSKNTIKDILSRADMIASEMQGLLGNSQVVDISYLSDGTVKAIAAVKLTDPFIDLILPRTIRDINPVQQPQIPKHSKDENFTGLILDCRGFKVNPAIVPRIIDENGAEIYGSASVSREHVIRRGMAGYARDFKAAQANGRVANKPLIVKGIRTGNQGLSDIVISNADAAKIKGTASNLSFLQKCRVIMVLD